LPQRLLRRKTFSQLNCGFGELFGLVAVDITDRGIAGVEVAIERADADAREADQPGARRRAISYALDCEHAKALRAKSEEMVHEGFAVQYA
jgi:uncharacterized protein YqfA (UPF0365 family)